MNKFYPFLSGVLCLVSLFGQPLDSRFHTLDEIHAFLENYSADSQYDTRFRVDTIGVSSRDQLPILAAVLSNNVQVREDEPRLLFVGQVHAEEVLGVEAVLRLIEELLDPAATQALHVNTLMANCEIWVIPTLNPEGMNVVYSGDDITFRKNKTDFSPEGPWPNGIFDFDPSIGNDIDGVDINRNFGLNWVFGDTFMEPDPSTYGSHYDYYRGPEPWSEPESVALRDLALAQNFLFSIVWHSSRSGRLSETVYTSWEWGGNKYSPDYTSQKMIGDHLASLIIKEDGSGSYLSSWSMSRNGKAHDWIYAATGCFQYLIECGTSNIQPDSALIEDTIDRILPSMYYLMDRSIGYNVNAAQLSGVVTDGSTGQAFPGVTIVLAQRTGAVLAPRRTDEFGRFRRIVNPGTYTVKAHFPGYEPATQNITVNNSVVTNMAITLSPLPVYELATNILPGANPPASPDLRLILQTKAVCDTHAVTYGNQTWDVYPGIWKISLIGNGIVPITRTIQINGNSQQNLTVSLPDNEITISPGDPGSWEEITGPWFLDENELRTQSGFLYPNADTIPLIPVVRTPMYSVGGATRVAAVLTHRYELEWDYDSIRVGLRNEKDALATYSIKNQHWDANEDSYLTLTDSTGMDSVEFFAEFYRDNSVNYRGWVLTGLSILSLDDPNLSIAGEAGNNIQYVMPTAFGPFPNPSNGQVSFDLANWRVKPEIVVYNILGQEIYHTNLSGIDPGRQRWSVNLKSLAGGTLATGVYFVKINNPERTLIRKCVYLRN